MTDDSALAYLLADAKRLGMTLAEYERHAGIILVEDGPRPSPAAQRIRRHEISAGLMADADIAIATLKEKRRAFARRRLDLLSPSGECD